MRAFLAVALIALGTAAGCADNGVGRKCLVAGGASSIMGLSISSPSLECMTRLCFLNQGAEGMAPRQVCTARCDTDDDCKPNLLGDPTMGFCPTGSKFVCAAVVDVGDFACKKLCTCFDDLIQDYNKDVSQNVKCPDLCNNKCAGPNG